MDLSQSQPQLPVFGRKRVPDLIDLLGYCRLVLLLLLLCVHFDYHLGGRWLWILHLVVGCHQLVLVTIVHRGSGVYIGGGHALILPKQTDLF